MSDYSEGDVMLLMKGLDQAAAKIERLQEAERRALAIADERSKENAEQRAALERMKWKPIETNGFMSAKRYLVVEANGLAIPFIGFRIYENGPWLSDSGSEAQEVWPTHWMDLPEA